MGSESPPIDSTGSIEDIKIMVACG